MPDQEEQPSHQDDPGERADAARAQRAHEVGHGSLAEIEGEHVSNEDLLELPCEILIPAAIQNQITEKNAEQLRCRLLVEGANGPTTLEADAILAKRGIFVVPDILANAGGVVVSYFEWVQANQAYWWSETEVEARLADRMTNAWQQVLAESARRDLPLRTAATCLAVRRVAEAHRQRGLYP